MPAESLEVAYRLLVAHARGMEGLRAAAARNAGIVLNLMPTFPDDPYRDDPVLRQAARHIDGLQNHLWLDALAGRGINTDVVASTAGITDWSFVTSADETAIGAPLDWLGVNYYTVQRLVPFDESAERAVAQDVSAHPGCPPVHFAPREPLTTMGWEINADGLGTTLRKTAEAVPGVPLWVGENGMACPDVVVDGQCDDPDRVSLPAGPPGAGRGCPGRRASTSAGISRGRCSTTSSGPRGGASDSGSCTSTRTPRCARPRPAPTGCAQLQQQRRSVNLSG